MIRLPRYRAWRQHDRNLAAQIILAVLATGLLVAVVVKTSTAGGG